MIWLLLGSAALADDTASIVVPEMSAQDYRPPVDAKQTLWADDSSTGPDLYANARLAFGYVANPFVYVYDDDGERVKIVGSALSVDAIGAITFKRVRFGVDVPFYPVASGDITSGGGLGDLAIDLKGTAIDGKDGPLGLAFGARLAFPTATTKVPLGYNGLGWSIEAIADEQVTDQLLIAANLGTLGVPKTTLSNVSIGQELFLRVGGGYAVNDDAGASLDFSLTSAFADFFQGPATPIEAMVGGWDRVADDFVVRAGVGTGLTRGIGSPTARVVLSVAYEPPPDKDTDLDGILDSKDACIDKAEDVDQFEDTDGCPDDDNDKDGIADLQDQCRDQAEDKDGYQDEDGCPDPKTAVHVHLTDSINNPVPGVATVINGDTAREVGDDDFVVELMPGHYAMSADAKGWVSLKKSFEVKDGAPMDLRYQMERDVPPGLLHVMLVDPSNKPLTGTVSFNDGAPVTAEKGDVSQSLPPMTYVVLARVDGYVPQSQSINLPEGGKAELKIVLKPAKVVVTKEKLDIKDKIYFETGKATIKPESYALLDEIAGVLLDRPDILEVSIEGHTDSRGDDAKNMKLSQDRAESVRQYLINKGVEDARLKSVGYGETRPVDPANNEKAWEKNRRVEFLIMKWQSD